MSNILANVTTLVESAVERYGSDDDVNFAVSMTAVPSQQAGGVAPVLMIVLTIPGPEIGSRMMATTVSMDLHLHENAVDETVRNVIEGLRQERSRVLAEAMAQQNGHGQPPV